MSASRDDMVRAISELSYELRELQAAYTELFGFLATELKFVRARPMCERIGAMPRISYTVTKTVDRVGQGVK